jgi:hypothetical protein
LLQDPSYPKWPLVTRLLGLGLDGQEEGDVSE